MKNQKQNNSFSLKKLSMTLDRIDQNIEEWMHHFINQIEQESNRGKCVGLFEVDEEAG